MAKQNALKILIEKQNWFHAIAFSPSLVSPGRNLKDKPANYTLFGTLKLLEHIELKGMNCADIGTMDGLVAFNLKTKGADYVIATDIAKRQQFIAAKEFLKLDIDYQVPVKVTELASSLKNKKLDLIVCAGVLYHVFEPLTMLIKCRESLKNNGLLILETQYLSDESESVISFSPSDERLGNQHPNVFFVPSYKALCGMLNMASFNIVTTIANHGRITILAQAVRPCNLKVEKAPLENVIKKYSQYNNYKEDIDYIGLENATESSMIMYTGPQAKDYYLNLYDITFQKTPLQPKSSLSPLNLKKLRIQDFYRKTRTEFARKKRLPDFKL